MTTPIEELTRRWAAAWTHTRRVLAGEVAGWPLVYVGSASRTTEIVCAEPDHDTWESLLGQIAGDRGAMLTLVAHRPEVYVGELPPGVRIDRDDETLMLLHHENVVQPPPREAEVTGYYVDVEDDGDRVTVRLVREGRVAAEGTVGILGKDAVYDMVETLPAFRRRGLASAVMTELARAAADRGTSTGLLAATTEGAGLYRSLGWADVAPMRSLMGTAGGPVRRLRVAN
ncbi:MAG: GNAT family N-acetyltransferase [Marmoricola sp.]